MPHHLFSEDQEFCICGVTVISGYRPAGRTVDQRKNPRANHGLFFVWDGYARFSDCEGDSFTVQPGELLYIPAGSRYKMQYAAEATAFILVNFHLFALNGEKTALGNRLTLVARDDSSHRLWKIMTDFERCGPDRDPSASFRKKELIYKLLGTVYEESGPLAAEGKKYSAILPGVMLLQQTYLENIPMNKFAEACNISLTSFRSLFTQKYGMSPLRYRNQLRINRAIALLQEGSCTVAEAAYAAGVYVAGEKG